jgi:lipoprotein-anchoring transpeptidase ErfK/SrfK
MLLGGPLTSAQPLEMTVYADKNKGVSSMPFIPPPKPHPVTRLVNSISTAIERSIVMAAASTPVTVASPVTPVKEIIISLDDQRLYRFEDGRIIATHLVSTGVPGHRTPPGDYKVYTKRINQWSTKYECSMLHWNGISRDGMYGIHALTGKSYLKKLGHVASHGCIRLSPDDAIATYEWADIGTPVTIVGEFNPEPYLPSSTSTYIASGSTTPGVF